MVNKNFENDLLRKSNVIEYGSLLFTVYLIDETHGII